MPLRDHFHPKWRRPASWDMFHGQWPAMLVLDLKKILPPGYLAGPLVHLGRSAEVDIGAFEKDDSSSFGGMGGGGVATAPWPTKPTSVFKAVAKEYDEYEVRIYDEDRGQTLVAAIELVSPSNKDRPERRRAFVEKCEALLRNGVCVSIIDLVTYRTPNLYGELRKELGSSDSKKLPPLYAVTCRMLDLQLEAWEHTLTIGEPLPKLPIWLNEELAIGLELEPSYEATCDVFDIPQFPAV